MKGAKVSCDGIQWRVRDYKITCLKLFGVVGAFPACVCGNDITKQTCEIRYSKDFLRSWFRDLLEQLLSSSPSPGPFLGPAEVAELMSRSCPWW